VRWAAIELALAGVAGAVGLVAARPAATPSRAFAGALPATAFGFLAAWVALLVAIYAAGLGAFQLWYTTAPVLGAVFLSTLPALAALVRGRRLLACVLIALTAVQSVTRVASELARGAASPDLLATGALLRERLQHAAGRDELRVGAFDSGQLSYRVHPFPVTNLDGVMNHAAARAIAAGDLAAYLHASGCTHILSDASRLHEFQRVSPFDARLDVEMSAALGVDTYRIETGEPAGVPSSSP
jgi:hypothetical protein